MNSSPFSKLHGLILAGGQGTRLWPISTANVPKPLLRIGDEKTLIERTINRLQGLIGLQHTFVVTTSALSDAVLESLPFLSPKQVILEPVGRNTGPCIALSARKIAGEEENAVMAVLPADHIILNEEHFRICLACAARLASDSDSLVLLGLKAQGPETSYGYIQLGDSIGEEDGVMQYRGARFEEKPNARRVRELLATHHCLWNSGIYVGKAKVFLEETRKHLPEVFEVICGADLAPSEFKDSYASLPAISIDHGITRHLESFLVVSTGIERVDVGNLESLSSLFRKDEFGNSVYGEFTGVDCRNSIVYSSGKKIAAIGLKDMVIVDTADAVLVCPRNRSNEVSKLVDK